ncbi:MAG: tripartite tricarboxylate transporter TctB family protein [Rhodospirillales bacterium]
MSEDNSLARDTRGVQWGHLAFLVGILGFLGYYLLDSWFAQASVGNLIFVLPVTVLCVFTVTMIGIALVRRTVTEQDQDGAGGDDNFLPLALSISLFAIYVALLPTLGMDVGTFLFIALVLVVLGERRPLFVISYALAFSALTVLGLKAMIPTNIPTLIL